MVAISLVASVAIVTLLAWHLGVQVQDEAKNAGFKNVEDMQLAKAAGASDSKVFYADTGAMRERVKLKRMADEADARALAEWKEREHKAAEAEQQKRDQAQEKRAQDAAKELATPPATPRESDTNRFENPERVNLNGCWYKTIVR